MPGLNPKRRRARKKREQRNLADNISDASDPLISLRGNVGPNSTQFDITNYENTLLKLSLDLEKTQESITPCRPGYGQSNGSELIANYYPLVLKPQAEEKPNQQWFAYALTVKKCGIDHQGNPIKTDGPVGKKLTRIIALFVRGLEQRHPLLRNSVATDFRENVITSNKIPGTDDDQLVFTVEYENQAVDQGVELKTNRPKRKATYDTTWTAAISVRTSTPSKIPNKTLLSNQKSKPNRLENLTNAPPQPSGSGSSTGPLVYEVSLRFKRVYDIDRFVDHYMYSPHIPYDETEKSFILQVINIIFNQDFKNPLNTAVVGASHSGFPLLPPNLHRSMPLGTNPRVQWLDVLRGFYSSARLSSGRLLLNISRTHGVFFRHGISLEDLIKTYQASRGSSPEEMHRLGKTLRGLRVQTTHLPTANFVTQVFRLETGTARDITFNSMGADTSIQTYFNRVYPNAAVNARTLVVATQSRKNTPMFPVTVLKVLPGQFAKAKLNADESAMMVDFACKEPRLVYPELQRLDPTSGLETAARGICDTQLKSGFSITMEDTLVRVPSRTLSMPGIQYRNQKVNGINHSGLWYPPPRAIFEHIGTSPRGDWKYVLLDWECHPSNQGHIRGNAVGWGRKLTGYLERVGLTMWNPKPLYFNLDVRTPERIRTGLENVFRKMTRAPLILFVLPEKHTEVYRVIKKLGDVVNGISTVCVTRKKFSEGNIAYLGNVALKINLKLGGMNHNVVEEGLSLISSGNTMVVGIDVVHPPAGSVAAKEAGDDGSTTGGPTTTSTNDEPNYGHSVAGMVASMGPKLGQWPGILRIQPFRKEEVVGLTEMLCKQIERWRYRYQTLKPPLRPTSQYPRNIIVYRDGVSESQYEKVYNEERKALEVAMQHFGMDKLNPSTKLTIIVVGKRHHTRFFQKQGINVTNPDPGTVVDRGITEAKTWDFFLQSHVAMKGTARPAHYIVVYDQVLRQEARKLSAVFPNGQVLAERLSYGLCYAYGCANRAVSIPAPVFYADRLCERAKVYLAGNEKRIGDADVAIRTHPNLVDKMFYI